MIRFSFIALCLFALAPRHGFADGPDKQSPEEIAAAKAVIARDFSNIKWPQTFNRKQQRKILASYQHLDPRKEVPTDLLEATVVFFDQNKASFPNQGYITIVDFAKKSNIPRFFVIDMSSGNVQKFYTIHGWGSDRNDDGLAEAFGNEINSGMSSIGFIRTAEVYSGKYKRAVRLDGLSTTNSNIRDRAIVVHGFDDVHEKPVKQGLGWGCPALDWAVKDGVIDKIAEGSLMFIGVSK